MLEERLPGAVVRCPLDAAAPAYRLRAFDRRHARPAERTDRTCLDFGRQFRGGPQGRQFYSVNHI